MRTNGIDQRARRTVPVQCVSDTGHKDAPSAVVAYSTEGRRHQSHYPDPAKPPAIGPIPDSVHVWNIESQASIAISFDKASNVSQVTFVLRRELWESIGRPARISIAGDPRKGFTVTWGGAYAVQYNAASTISNVKISVKPAVVGLPREFRPAHVVRACSRNGTIEIEPPHPLWLANDRAFKPTGLTHSGHAKAPVQLSANPQSGTVATKNASQGPTAPLPKARPTDLPAPTEVEILKGQLKQKLVEAMDIKKRLEAKSGLKLKLTASGNFIVEM